MSLGYFMNTRWGGLAAAVAAQVPEELHSLNPAAYSDESSNQFAFALPYAAPLSIANSIYPAGSVSASVSASAAAAAAGGGGASNNSNNNNNVQVQAVSHPYASFGSVDLGLGLSVDPLSRLSSPSMVRGLNSYPPAASGHGHNTALGNTMQAHTCVRLC